MATNDENKGIGPYSEQCFIKDFMIFFHEIHGKNHSDYDSTFEIKNSLLSEPRNILKVDRLSLNSDFTLSAENQANEGSVTFMSKLSSPHAQTLVENVPKELMSNLQPKVELYKVYYSGPEDKEGIAVPLPFNNFKSPGEQGWGSRHNISNPIALTHGGLPGHLAVGLKELSFDYLGTNPAEVDYYINVRMKLWFSTPDAMFYEYPPSRQQKKAFDSGGYALNEGIKFANLIERPMWIDEHITLNSPNNHRRWENHRFRIRLDISYSEPSPNFLEEACQEIYAGTAGAGLKSYGQLKEELFEAITSIKTSFFLNLLRHNFNFLPDNPSGPFELEILYNGAVESALYSPDANILRARGQQDMIEKLKRNNPHYEGMQRAATSLEEESGFSDVYKLQESMFFGWENSGLEFFGSGKEPHKNYYIFKGGDKIDYETHPGLDEAVKQLPKNQVEYNYKESTFGDNVLDKLASFFNYKAAWNKFLENEGLAEHQIRSRAYTRIMEELSAKKECVGGRTESTVRPGRIYSVKIPSSYVIEWRKKSSDRLLKTAEKAEIKRIEQGGGGKDSRKKIEKIRDDRQNRVSAATGSARALRHKILEELYNKLKKKDDFIEKLEEIGDTPNITVYEQKEWKQKKWEDQVGEYVQNKMKRTEEPADTVRLEKILLPSARPPTTSGPKYTTITWFYFGDLIDAALDILRDNGNDAKKLHLNLWRAPSRDDTGQLDYADAGGSVKVVLGDVTYFDPISGKKRTISLLDLPISYELFREFWANKVIKPMLTRYSFKTFLRDAMNELVAAALTNKCALDGEPVVGIRPHIFQTSVPEDAKRRVFPVPPSNPGGKDRAWRARIFSTDPSEKVTQGAPLTDLPDQKMVTAGTQVKIYDDPMNENLRRQEIIYLCATTVSPVTLLTANKKTDIKNGILYLEIGTDGTPVERISFHKQDVPGFLESKGEVSGIKGNPVELSEPYHCNFSMYGNTMIKPGKYVYIRLPHFGDPSKAPRSPARRLGLGGYFFIVRTSNVLTLRGNKFDWTTNVKCLWDSFGGSPELSRSGNILTPSN